LIEKRQTNVVEVEEAIKDSAFVIASSLRLLERLKQFRSPEQLTPSDRVA
jgi:hypothetical protein